MADSPLQGSDGAWRPGDRVSLDGRRGRVGFERSGFVRVYWDDGDMSEVWGASLAREEGLTQ